MTDRQLEIHKGLSSIGTEIAAFYHDGVILSEMDLDTKPYLLGHLSREIESGLRDVLTPKSLEDIEICEECSRPLNRKIGHKESIIHSLGLDDETEFVKQWYKVAKQFPKYAHRHGVWKDPWEQEALELDSYILSVCCKWLNSVEEIDEELYEVLLNSAIYINQRDRYSVIESLSTHINNYPERVGNILIEIFKKAVSYDISREKLQEMVENLYGKGLKDIADKICLLHGEKGFHFLRCTYDKYNS